MLCVCSLLQIYTKKDIPLLESRMQESATDSNKKATYSEKTSSEILTIYTPTRFSTNFSCFTIHAKKAPVFAEKRQSAKVIVQLKKGQKLCHNFPQNIAHTKLQITLKDIENKWLRTTLMNDSILLRGYVAVEMLGNHKPKKEDFLPKKSGGLLVLYDAPKITSQSIPNAIGNSSMQHILEIAKQKLALRDYELARSWLAFAQQTDENEMQIYILYMQLLEGEGKIAEAQKLQEKLQEAKIYPSLP